MTKEDKTNLIAKLGNFQRDEWDNLDDDEFLAITTAIGVIMANCQGAHYELV